MPWKRGGRTTKVKLKCGHTIVRWDIGKRKTNMFYCDTCRKRVERSAA